MVVDDEVVIVIKCDGLCWTTCDDVIDDVLATFLFDVVLDFFLIDLHVVSPGTDDGEVRALNCILAIVRATGDLELELVRQRRAMHVDGEIVYHPAVD